MRKGGRVQGQNYKLFNKKMWRRWLKESNSRPEPELAKGLAELRWKIGLVELANYRLRLPD